MSKRTAALLLVLSLGACPLALAQGDHEIPWPAGLGIPEIFGRSVAGDMSGDGIPDAVVLDGQRALYLFDPHLHGAVVEIPVGGPVADITMIRAQLPTTPARLVCAVGNSLVAVTLAVVPGSDPPVLHFETQTLYAGPWTQIDLIRAVDVDHDGDADFIGVADAETVFRVTCDGGNYAAGLSFEASAPVREIEGLYWDNTDLEIGLHTDDGVRVHDLDGEELFRLRNAFPGMSLDTIRTAGKRDRLAWVTLGTEEVLLTLDATLPAGYEGPVAFDFSALPEPPADVLEVVAVVGCDHDGDGNEDVVVLHQGAHEALVYRNEDPATPMIGLEPFAAVPFGPAGPAPNQFARPVAEDLNSDGFGDLLLPVQDGPSFALRLGPFPELGVSEGAPPPLDFEYLSATYCCNETLDLAVRFDDPSPLATHVNLVIWRQPDPQARLEAGAVANFMFAIEEPGALAEQFDMQVPIEEACDDELPSDQQPFGALLNFEIRLVKANPATGVEYVVSKTYTGCYSSEASLDQAGHVEFFEVECLPEFLGSIIVGGFVPFPNLPCFVDGMLPMVPPPVYL